MIAGLENSRVTLEREQMEIARYKEEIRSLRNALQKSRTESMNEKKRS